MLFPFGKVVTGSDFVGRKNEITKIKTFLSEGENIILIAPRRYGKTSLVWNVLEDLKKNHYIGYVDFFSVKNLYELSEKIIESVLNNRHKIFNFMNFLKNNIEQLFNKIEFKQTIEEFSFILSLKEKNKNPIELLEQSIDFIEKIAVKDNKKFIFFFDEFSDIDKLDGIELQKLIRTKIQYHKNVNYVFAGSHESTMRNIFTSKKSPFFKIGRIEFLNTILKEEYFPYIKKKYKSRNIKINDKELNKIFKITGGHPYYTQLLCQNIYYELENKKTVTDKTVGIAFENSINYELPFLEKQWEELLIAKNQLLVIEKILKGYSPYSLEKKGKNTYLLLKTLENKGIIKNDNQKIIFIDPFFEFYLKQQFGIDTI
jgi:hypothetical protein